MRKKTYVLLVVMLCVGGGGLSMSAFAAHEAEQRLAVHQGQIEKSGESEIKDRHGALEKKGLSQQMSAVVANIKTRAAVCIISTFIYAKSAAERTRECIGSCGTKIKNTFWGDAGGWKENGIRRGLTGTGIVAAAVASGIAVKQSVNGDKKINGNDVSGTDEEVTQGDIKGQKNISQGNTSAQGQKKAHNKKTGAQTTSGNNPSNVQRAPVKSGNTDGNGTKKTTGNQVNTGAGKANTKGNVTGDGTSTNKTAKPVLNTNTSNNTDDTRKSSNGNNKPGNSKPGSGSGASGTGVNSGNGATGHNQKEDDKDAGDQSLLPDGDQDANNDDSEVNDTKNKKKNNSGGQLVRAQGGQLTAGKPGARKGVRRKGEPVNIFGSLISSLFGGGTAPADVFGNGNVAPISGGHVNVHVAVDINQALDQVGQLAQEGMRFVERMGLQGPLTQLVNNVVQQVGAGLAPLPEVMDALHNGVSTRVNAHVLGGEMSHRDTRVVLLSNGGHVHRSVESSLGTTVEEVTSNDDNDNGNGSLSAWGSEDRKGQDATPEGTDLGAKPQKKQRGHFAGIHVEDPVEVDMNDTGISGAAVNAHAQGQGDNTGTSQGNGGNIGSGSSAESGASNSSSASSDNFGGSSVKIDHDDGDDKSNAADNASDGMGSGAGSGAAATTQDSNFTLMPVGPTGASAVSSTNAGNGAAVGGAENGADGSGNGDQDLGGSASAAYAQFLKENDEEAGVEDGSDQNLGGGARSAHQKEDKVGGEGDGAGMTDSLGGGRVGLERVLILAGSREQDATDPVDGASASPDSSAIVHGAGSAVGDSATSVFGSSEHSHATLTAPLLTPKKPKQKMTTYQKLEHERKLQRRRRELEREIETQVEQEDEADRKAKHINNAWNRAVDWNSRSGRVKARVDARLAAEFGEEE